MLKLIDFLVEKDSEDVFELSKAFRKYLAENTFHKLIYEAKTTRTVEVVYRTLKGLDVVYDTLPSIEKGLKDYNSMKFRPLLLLIMFIVRDV